MWVLSQLSLCTHISDRSLYNYFSISGQFFIFLVIKIHQVIWPSPGTLPSTNLFSTVDIDRRLIFFNMNRPGWSISTDFWILSIIERGQIADPMLCVCVVLFC